MYTTRILIVEDEALIAEDLRDRLERLGHTVIEIVDATEDAIAAARREPPGLILMDVRLRGDGDGIDAAALIAERADVPIVFMTAHSDADTIARAMLIRPYGYVVKPIRDADLITAIQTALLRHAAEDRLRANESQTLEILEHTSDLILQLLPDGRVLSANPACRLALGYSPGELCRLGMNDLVAAPDRDAAARAVWQAAGGAAAGEIVLTLLSRDGRGVPVAGVVGRHRVGPRLDRLWAVFRAAGDGARGHPSGAARAGTSAAESTP
jgi:PAS domain S-box-containing protein